MTKKPSRKMLKNKADKLWSLAIRARGACEKCGRTPPEVTLQGAHIVPRRYLKVRFDLDNGLCLCASCHGYFTHFPIEFDLFVNEHVGETKYRELRERAIGTAGKVDYEAVIEELKKVAA